MHTSNEDILNGKERSNTFNIGTTKVNIEDFHSRNHYTYDENRIYMHLAKLSSSNDEKETFDESVEENVEEYYEWNMIPITYSEEKDTSNND